MLRGPGLKSSASVLDRGLRSGPPLAPDPLLENMTDNALEILRVGFPKWFKVLYGVCIVGFFIVIMYIFAEAAFLHYIGHNLRGMRWGYWFVVAIEVLGICFYVEVVPYFVVATEEGLRAEGMFGREKSFLWEEIAEVRRPRLSTLTDLAYIVSNSGAKIVVLRSMTNYPELVQLIEQRGVKQINVEQSGAT